MELRSAAADGGGPVVTAALDVVVQARTRERAKEPPLRFGLACLLIGQDRAVVEDMADDVGVLGLGTC
jgi:ABC-type dipeptide/oligopeptide/nickel transport system ATPase component